MESTNTNHTVNDGAKASEKMLNDITKGMMDVFTKQLNTVTSFYSNLFNSNLGNTNSWNGNGAFQNMFQNPMSNFSGNNFQNPFFTSIDKMMKQMVDNNTNIFSNVKNGLNTNVDMIEANKKYQEIIAARMETYKNIIKSTSEAYSKQLESTIDSNKKIIEETTDQLNLIATQNQTFWMDLMNSFQMVSNKEEKIIKEPINSDIKKKPIVIANEFSDHKA